jgi:DNA-3-methyladenine glycosylase
VGGELALGRALLWTDVHAVARGLIGATFLVDGVGGILVEVEAYQQDDPASHAYRGPTPRNCSMFGPPGHLYVYRSYGVHWCANVVCGDEGVGMGALLRALEPTHGLERMHVRRELDDALLLCAGPGRLTQALGLTGAHDGLPLDRSPFELLLPRVPAEVVCSPRVGISRASDVPWRYSLSGSPFVSRPRPRA